MANSPSHRFGQLVGDLLEELMYPNLETFCSNRGLFLDRKGSRKARSGKKLSWTDHFGNSHDLDFVIEKDGKPEKLGRPLAFIEAAWRRYTKHSRAKAQEIQGAILPIAQRYEWDKPFLGIVLAGEFTDASIEQMNSSGFITVLFPYETIVAAFQSIGVDAAFDEKTPDATFAKTTAALDKIKNSDPVRWQSLQTHLWESNKAAMGNFLKQLEKSLDRRIQRVVVIPLSGSSTEFTTVDYAANFLNQYDESTAGGPFQRYEISVKFSNGDKVDASFSDKGEALRFLQYVSS